MANHYRVSPKYWLKARRNGWSDDEILLGLYLLTCKHRNLEGLYQLPKPYIAADLGWAPRKVDNAFNALCTYGFVQYDDEAEMVLIPKALKHQAPSTDNQIKGAIAQLERIPRTSLWDAFRMACTSHCPKLADAISERWPSDSEGSSHARAGSRAPASSSNSISSSSSTPAAADEVEDREEVVELCNLLADRIRANDPQAKVAPESRRWRDAMRLLVDVDGREPEQVAHIIRWSQADEFWRSNILSPSKLREKFTQLLGRANQNGARSQTGPTAQDFLALRGQQ